MIETFLRFIKRFLIFLPGILVTYFAIRDIYPVINRRLPATIAVLTTYVIAAYVIIPLCIRLIRLFSTPRHVPFYSTTPDGFASDPLNIALFGTSQGVVNAMSAIGWKLADARNLKTLAKLGAALLLKRAYPNAPFSNLYLLGRSQDLGFQLSVDNNPRHRHHVRFWAVKPAVAERFKEHLAFWQTLSPDKELDDEKYLWLGAASLDTGLGIIRHNAQITHMIHHDTNAERKLIVSSLNKAGQLKSQKTVKIAKPYQLRNRVITGYLQTDGKLTICEL